MDNEGHSLAHSPFHATKAAYCRTPWQMMTGDERCRSCPTCGGMAYKIEQFPEETFTTMIAESEGIDPAQLHLYRRHDGTFVARNLPCSGSTLGAFTAWKEAVRDVCSIAVKTPRWTSVLVVAGVLQPALSGVHPDAYSGIYVLAMMGGLVIGLLYWIAQLALTCRISTAMIAKFEKRDWQPSKQDFARQRSVGLNSLLFSFVSYALAWLLIFPGVYFASRACLAVMFIVRDEAGPLSAFGKSAAITKGHMGHVVRTLLMPAIIMLLSWIGVQALTLLIFSLQQFLFKGALAHPWPLQSIQNVLNAFVTLTFLPLQAKLYVELKHKMDAALIKQSDNVIEFKKSNRTSVDIKSREQAEP